MAAYVDGLRVPDIGVQTQPPSELSGPCAGNQREHAKMPVGIDDMVERVWNLQCGELVVGGRVWGWQRIWAGGTFVPTVRASLLVAWRGEDERRRRSEPDRGCDPGAAAMATPPTTNRS
jgi:hypothetical protein